MTGHEWIKDRTLKELLELRQQLQCFGNISEEPKHGVQRRKRLKQVEDQLLVRQKSVMGFMDRLDQSDA